MKISQARDWQYSNDHCRHHGGDLASIHSKAENDYINGDYWVGLIKMQPGGQRKWADNTIQDYTNWGEGGNVTSNIKLIMYSLFRLHIIPKNLTMVQFLLNCYIFRTK